MKKYSTLAYLFLVLNSCVLAQWTPTNGLIRERVFCIEISGDTLIAGGHGEAYYSIDNGDNWQVLYSGPEDDMIFTILVDGNFIYAGTSQRLMISADRGASWTENSSEAYIVSMVKAGDTLYIATHSKVYYSLDHGESLIYAGLNLASGINVLAYQNGILYAGTSYKIFRSADHGLTWQKINLDTSLSESFYSIEVKGDSIYAGGFERLFFSNDNGVSWNLIADLGSGLITGIAPVNDTIYCSGWGGSFMTYNHGGDWAGFDAEGHSINNCIALKDNYIFVGADFGLTRSEVSNLSGFRPSDKGMSKMDSYEIFSYDSLVFSFSGSRNVCSDTYTLSRSLDGGLNWLAPELRLGMSMLPGKPGSLSVYRDTLYSAYGNNDIIKNSLIISSYSHYPGPEGVNCFEFSGDTVFCGSAKGVHYSIDYCRSWTRCNDGIWSYDITDLQMVNGDLYASTADQGIFRSDNNGAQWTEVRQGLNSWAVSRLFFLDQKLFSITDDGLFVLNSSGSSWNKVTAGLEGIKINDVAYSGNDLLIATDFGVFISHNQGQDWLELNNGIEGKEALSLEVTDHNILVGTRGSSVFSCPLGSLGMNSPEKETVFIYPNPVKDFIHFEGIDDSYEVTVLDISGKINLNFNMRNHSVDLSRLSSGIYVIRFTKGLSVRSAVFQKM